jgi:hypothetical protein
VDLRDGILIFLCADIEESTPEKSGSTLGQHHDASVKPRGEGDGRFVVLRDAEDAPRPKLAIQIIKRQTERLRSSP